MRSSGVTDTAGGFGRHDHLCWGYDERDSFIAAATQYLRDGLDLNQRVLYTGPGTSEQLRRELHGLADLDRLIETGAVVVTPVDQSYGGRHREGPAGQAEAYAAATRDALAAGFTGLRAAADATPLVLTDDDRDAFVRYEHRVDQLMADGLPFAALCAYDRAQLGSAAVDELACVHPLAHDTATPFRLHAHAPSSLRLSGEIDAFDRDTARVAFDRTLSGHVGPGPVRVDCSDLDFVSHRGLEALNAVAADLGVRVTLIDPPSTAGWLIELLELGSLYLDPAAA